MPIKRGKDSRGPYYRYGSRKKYYYKSGSKRSRDIAYKKAHRQMVAILATGWREPGKRKRKKKKKRKRK
jgi:hypothetical protein